MTMQHDPRQLRDNEIRRLAFDEGVAVPVIAKRYGVTESRVSQILDVTSNRQRIWHFLDEHPSETYTARRLAQTLSMDINRVQFYIDSLRKKGAVTGVKRKSGGKESGDHTMWFDIKIKRRPAGARPAKIEAKVVAPAPTFTNGETAAITSEVIVPEEGPATIETISVIEKVAAARKTPWPDDVLTGWPAFREVRDRARKAQLRAQAAKLLEEAGDDEDALRLLEKTSFTALEEEVIKVLKRYGEL